MRINKKNALRQQAAYLEGTADAFKVSGSNSALSGQLELVAKELNKAANNMCSNGFYGCRDTPEKPCTSDHK